MALKKCFKLHKLFVAEIERCDRIDREGVQVLSSLANVAARVPKLVDAADTLGVLAYTAETPSLLLAKHFVAMEKSASLLRDINRDVQDAVRRVRTFVDEMTVLVDDVFSEEGTADDASSKVVQAVMELLEWMENVAAMYEREALRKRLLVQDLEYSNVARLQQLHHAWPASAAVSFVDVDYVRMGSEVLPPVMHQERKSTTTTQDNIESNGASKKKKKTKSKS